MTPSRTSGPACRSRCPPPTGSTPRSGTGCARSACCCSAAEGCRRWQWGPEWVCHRCRSFDLAYAETEPVGVIYSHQRIWHPVHPAVADQGPYVVVLVELAHADGVRMVGNLLGDPLQDLIIGTPVQGVFEHHPDAEPAHTLLQWAARGLAQA